MLCSEPSMPGSFIGRQGDQLEDNSGIVQKSMKITGNCSSENQGGSSNWFACSKHARSSRSNNDDRGRAWLERGRRDKSASSRADSL
jgi:hypothetical protein